MALAPVAFPPARAALRALHVEHRVQLDAVWDDAALAVEVVEKADPGDPHERSRLALRRVQVVQQLLAHLCVDCGEA